MTKEQFRKELEFARELLVEQGRNTEAFDRFFTRSWKFPPRTIPQHRFKSTTISALGILLDINTHHNEGFSKEQQAILKQIKVQLAATAAIFQSGMPFYYIPRGFCQMVKATNLGDIKIDLNAGFKPPYRGCQFLLPEGELHNVHVVSYGILDANTPMMDWLDVRRKASLATFALLDEDPETIAFNMSPINDGFLDTAMYPDESAIDHTPETIAATEEVMNFLIKLFAILNAEPELKIPEKILKKAKKKTFVQPATFVDVPILTKKTKYEHRGDGHHRSPRPHLRRGHVRQQHYGRGNTKTKMIWLRPTIVMKPEQ